MPARLGEDIEMTLMDWLHGEGNRRAEASLTWHYRILRHQDGTLALHEVYCDEAGRPNRYTTQPVGFVVDAEGHLQKPA